MERKFDLNEEYDEDIFETMFDDNNVQENDVQETYVDNVEVETNEGPTENINEHTEHVFVDEALRMIKGETDMSLINPPAEGMSFVNGDEFAAFCYIYAHKVGFQLIIKSNELMQLYKEGGVRRNGTGDKEPRFFMMKRIRFICIKGTKQFNPPCMVVIDARLRDDQIVITRCKLEHNHEVAPLSSRFMVGYRLMGDYFKRKALLYDNAGIPIAKNFNTLVMECGGHANLPFNGRDLRNMLNLERRVGRIEGDAAALEDYFLKMKADNPDFYYAIETDDKGVLVNVFWADARCRGMCKVFGDIVSYDSTFLCNR